MGSTLGARCLDSPWRLALVALCVTACGRVDYDPLPTLDAGWMDGSTIDAASGDAGWAPPVLDCADPVPALATAPPSERIEQALYVDGVTLVARTRGGTQLEARRPTVDAQFDPFGPITLLPSSVQDPTFIRYEGRVLAAVVVGEGTRGIVLCWDPPTAVPCDDVALFDLGDGTEIMDDVDGPSLAIVDGGLVLAFSRGPDVYLARPRGSDLAEWNATRLALGPVAMDDPALTVDGRFLFVPVHDAVTMVVAFAWNPTTASYEAPVVVVTTMSGPSVGLDTGTTIELFVTGDSRGVNEPHRFECVVSVD